MPIIATPNFKEKNQTSGLRAELEEHGTQQQLLTQI
jgi:hypothetical protein